MRWLIAVGALIAALGACGPRVEEVDITGIYKVDQAVGSAPCDQDLPVVAPAYVKFDPSTTSDGYEYTGCKDAAGTDCSSLGIVTTFPEATDGGWRNRDTYVSESAGDCFMGYFDMSATLDGTTLVFERFIYEEKMVPDAQCTHAEALARGEMMACVDHARWSMTAQ